MRLNDFKVLTFDCYGTLIDWECGMIRALKPLTDKVNRELTRDAILETHAKHESFQQQQTPMKRYQELLAIVYKRMAEGWGVPVTWDECLVYGQSIKEWPAFSDSAAALAYLKQHYKLVVLSNVDNESFASSSTKLRIEFDAIYTAEDIGSYKPSDRNFEYMLGQLKTLGFDKRDILHTAESLFHDHAPSNKHGLKSCWIHRRNAQEGSGATRRLDIMPSFDFRFNSLADFVDAHRLELER